MRQFSVVTAALVLVSGAAMAQSTPPRSSALGRADPDQSFLAAATEAGAAEVEVGKLAAQKARNAQVRKFGQHMVDDHSKANDKLTALVRQQNMQPPLAEPNAEHAGLTQRLENANSQDFDRLYMQAQVNDHLKAVELFKREAKQGRNAALKRFAASTLPTLRQHLKLAQQVAAQTTPQAATPPSYSRPSTWSKAQDVQPSDRHATGEELNRQQLQRGNENPAVQR